MRTKGIYKRSAALLATVALLVTSLLPLVVLPAAALSVQQGESTVYDTPGNWGLPQKNLLENGDFENGNTAWTGCPWVADGVGYEGSRGVKVVKPDSGYPAYYYKNTLDLKPNRTYRVTFRYHSPNGCSFRFVSSSASSLNYTPRETLTWQEGACYFTTTGGFKTSKGYDFGIAASKGTCYVDDLCLVELSEGLVSTDLAISEFRFNSSVRPGDEVTFSAKVTNTGSSSIFPSDAVRVKFMVGTETVRTVSLSRSLAAGESVTLTTEGMPWTAVKGDWLATAAVEGDVMLVRDTEATNDTVSKALYVAEADRAVPAVAAAAGFTELTFSDDFDTVDSIDITGSGKPGYKWYIYRPWSAGFMHYDEGDYYVENDAKAQDGKALTLSDDKSTYNYGLCNFDQRTGTGYAYNHGYMECRFWMPKDDTDPDHSGSPAIWSLPTTKLQDRAPEWVEVDYMEYYGYNDTRKNYYYTTTFHHSNSGRPNSPRNSNASQDGLGDEQYHIMGFLWQQDSWIAYLDGKEILRFTYGPEEMPNPASYGFEGAYEILEDDLMPTIISGARGFELKMDWLRVWQEPETRPAPGSSLTLDKTEIPMYRYETVDLHATQVGAGDQSGVLTWSSSNPKVATVHGDGRIRAAGAPGTAFINVTDRAGHYASCKVTVFDEGENLIENGHFESRYTTTWADFLNKGCTIAQGAGKTGNAMRLSLNKETFYYKKFPSLKENTTYKLSFDYKGQAVRTGFNIAATDNISVMYEGGNYTSTTDTWKTKTVYLTAGEAPHTNNDWIWYIVQSSTSKYTYIDNVSLVELPPVESATLTEPDVSVAIGATKQLNATVTPSNAFLGSMVWASLDSTVATVNSSGLVTGVKKGKTVVTATLQDGTVLTCIVTVDPSADRFTDGDFEAAEIDSKWAMMVTGSTASLATDPTDAGNHCSRIYKSASANCMYVQPVPVVENTSYRLTGRVYGQGNIYINNSYCTGKVGWNSVGKAGEWTTFSLDFSTKKNADCTGGSLNTYYVFGFGNLYSSTAIYFDDIRLCQTGVSAPTECLVVFLDDNGAILKAQKVTKGSSATPPTVTSTVDKAFSSWDGVYTNVQKDTRVVAVYNQCTHSTSHRVNVSASDCQTHGYTGDLVCDVCKAVLEKGTSLPLSGHKYKETVVPATKSAPGYTLHECEVCHKDSYKDNYTDYDGPDAFRLTVSNATVTVGKTATVKLTLENNPGVAVVVLTARVTDAQGATVTNGDLAVTDAENGALLEAFTFDKNLLWDTDGEATQDGLLATLTVTAAANAPLGDYRVEMLVRQCYGEDEGERYLLTTAGTVTVTDAAAIIYGDATGDTEVDSKDVVRLRKYLAAYDFETKTSTVDINPGGDATGDGTIDSKDVVRLRKYLAAYDFETKTSTVPLGPETT